MRWKTTVAVLALACSVGGCASRRSETRRELARTDTFAARFADDMEVRLIDVVIAARDSSMPEVRAAKLTLSRSRHGSVEAAAQLAAGEQSKADSEPAVKSAGLTVRVVVALVLLGALALALLSLRLGRGRQ